MSTRCNFYEEGKGSKEGLNVKWASKCCWFIGLMSVSLMIGGLNAAEAGSKQTVLAKTTPTEKPSLLSAFFGLDDSLPFIANLLCLGAWGKDGIPVVFSHTLNPESLQVEDFQVLTRSGVVATPLCVTLRPASDVGETRTVLLIGEFGNAVSDPPLIVRIVEDLFSDGAVGRPVNFSGSETVVTPLNAGPALVFAEVIPRSIWSQSSPSTDCPQKSKQVVRVTWAGGVRLPDREELGDTERELYRITLRHPDGSKEDVVPFALGDLADRDNNHHLCLDSQIPAVAVSFPSGHLVDPNGDFNPDTWVQVFDVSDL